MNSFLLLIGCHMQKWLMTLVSCFLIPCAAWAQDEVIKNYSPTDFEKFIKEDLKKDFAIEDGNYDIMGSPYFAYVNPKGKFVMFFAIIPKKALIQEPTLQKVNDWNVKAVYSRSYLAAALSEFY